MTLQLRGFRNARRELVADALCAVLVRVQVIASIEEPELIERILTHRREWGEEGTPMASLGARGPPQPWLF